MSIIGGSIGLVIPPIIGVTGLPAIGMDAGIPAVAMAPPESAGEPDELGPIMLPGIGDPAIAMVGVPAPPMSLDVRVPIPPIDAPSPDEDELSPQPIISPMTHTVRHFFMTA